LDNLSETLSLLRAEGVDVVVFGPSPAYDSALPRLLALQNVRSDASYARRHLNMRLPLLDERMNLAAKDVWHVQYVSSMQLLCPNGQCIQYAGDNVPLQFDGSHLTLQGSELLGRRISAQFPHLFDAN
jgi:hypothetical protein